VYLRFLRLGFKLSCVGIFTSFFLIPANLHGCKYDSTKDKDNQDPCFYLTDKVEMIALSHVSAGSPSLLATTVAAYIIFGSAMYFIFQEFKWFTAKRHEFCSKPRPDNYTLYIANIPEEYRSDVKLLEYFRSIFSKEAVLEAKVALAIPNLDKKVAARTKAVEKLEHAVNIRDVKGFEPTHMTPLGETLQSIPTFATELNGLNGKITEVIEKIEGKKKEEADAFELECAQKDAEEKDAISTVLSDSPPVVAEGTASLTGVETTVVQDPLVEFQDEDEDVSKGKHHRKTSTLSSTMGAMSATTKTLGKISAKTLGKMKDVLVGSKDLSVLDSGFVTFSTLLAKNQCSQIIHHATPFTFFTLDAPMPKDIVWSNVGKPHKEQQIGNLLAQVATVATCLLWTIPVSFLSSLSSVESLQELIPGMDKAIENNPWLPIALAQVSVLLLVILTALLPIILKIFCKHEGHIGSAELNASLLSKLAAFMIIQIFFVQALSGSVTEELSAIVRDPTQIVTLLATTVPLQVTSFIQFVQVQNFLRCGLELLRLPRLVMAWLRKCLGPNLTEKERNTTWMGIKPMTEPEEMEYPMIMSEMILYFMINLVYSCVAPIMSYILLIAFGLLSLVFRHQLIYTYSTKNDDGGKLWANTIRLLIGCMFLSEITLIGIIFLKLGFTAGLLLIPLIVISILFRSYINQQHFRVTEYVPSTLCSEADKANADLSFLNDQYLQPSLAEKTEFPENFSDNDMGKFNASKKETEGDVEEANNIVELPETV